MCWHKWRCQWENWTLLRIIIAKPWYCRSWYALIILESCGWVTSSCELSADHWPCLVLCCLGERIWWRSWYTIAAISRSAPRGSCWHSVHIRWTNRDYRHLLNYAVISGKDLYVNVLGIWSQAVDQRISVDSVRGIGQTNKCSGSVRV